MRSISELPVNYRTLGELAEAVGGELVGSPSVEIGGVAGTREAGPGDITFVANDKYAALLARSGASAAVVPRDLSVNSGLPVIRVDDPEAAFSRIVQYFAPEPVPVEKGIHPTAVVAEDARLGEGISIGAHVVIESGASVGPGTVIRPQVYVGYDVKGGASCVIHPNVTLCDRVEVGDNCIIHSGAVVGSDGFGYITRDGRHEKIPQVGTVVIEDDVEIGACVTIDRARFDRTWIRKGSKIDNLVQVAHNVVIGENCLVIAQVALAGSVHLGDSVVLAGKSAVDGHVTLGDGVVVAGKAGVTRDVPDGSCVSGFPAQSHTEELKLVASLRRVPKLYQKLKELEKTVRELEHTTDDDR